MTFLQMAADRTTADHDGRPSLFGRAGERCYAPASS